MLRCPKCESWFDPESEGSACKCPLCGHSADEPFAPQITKRWVKAIHWIIISGFGIALSASPLTVLRFDRDREMVLALFVLLILLYFVGTALARTVVGKVVCGTFLVIGTVVVIASIILGGCALLFGASHSFYP